MSSNPGWTMGETKLNFLPPPPTIYWYLHKYYSLRTSSPPCCCIFRFPSIFHSPIGFLLPAPSFVRLFLYISQHHSSSLSSRATTAFQLTTMCVYHKVHYSICDHLRIELVTPSVRCKKYKATTNTCIASYVKPSSNPERKEEEKERVCSWCLARDYGELPKVWEVLWING